MNPPGSGWAHKLLRLATGWFAPTLLSFALAHGTWAAPDAAPAKPALKLRNPDENVFSDLRPAAPDLGLTKTTESKADAEAARIYADAYGQDPEFYAFYQTLDAYKQTLQKNSSLLLTTSSDFYRYLKSINGVVPHATAKEGPDGPAPTQSRQGKP